MDFPVTIQAIAQFLFAIILALVPILIRYYAPVVKAWLDAKAKDAQWGVVVTVAFDVAKQAEQLKKSGAITDNAALQKWATIQLGNWLISRGIDLPIGDLTTAIESAVNDLPHADKKP